MIGYALDHILGLGISVAALYFASHRKQRFKDIAWSCLNAFSDCSMIFALAIQIAATLVLVREDFGKSTSNMGDDTVRITQAVSMVVLLALTYPILAFRMRPKQTKEAVNCRAEVQESSIRFGQFVFCWLLAFYPFYSKMNAAFGPSRIGNTHHSSGQTVLTAEQFEVIEQVCFGESRPITTLEDNFMTAFVILTYVPLSLFVLGRVLWLGVEEKHPGSRLHRFLQGCRRSISERCMNWILWGCYGAVPLLASGLLWSIIYTQRSQEQLTASFGGTDSDSDWTFGQIVALTVFAPVVIEGYRTYKVSEDGETEQFDSEEETKLDTPLTGP